MRAELYCVLELIRLSLTSYTRMDHVEETVVKYRAGVNFSLGSIRKTDNDIEISRSIVIALYLFILLSSNTLTAKLHVG